MRLLVQIIGIILILASCNKKKEPKFEYKNSDEVVKYKINIFGGFITDFSKYVNDDLEEITTFFISESEIKKTTRNELGEVISNNTYFMDNSVFAVSSIDSSFGDLGLWLTKSNYKYENDYLIEWGYGYWNYSGGSVDSGYVIIEYTIENGNTIKQKVMPNGWTSGITDYFTYFNYLNNIDIAGFSNGIKGKINNNLVGHILLQQGIPKHYGSSAYDDFSYEFDENDYVTKMLRTYTPSYNLEEPGVVTRTVFTTYYEYNFIR